MLAQKKYLSVMTCLLFISFGNAVAATWTGAHQIEFVDSLSSSGSGTYVKLIAYSNTDCDGHRLLINASNADNQKEIQAMVLSTFHANGYIDLAFNVNNGQCEVDRAIISRQ